MNTDVSVSSKTDNWATPQEFFDELNREFHFDLDPAADENNHKCDKYFTVKENGLLQSWGGYSVFCNPPYGREIGKWVEKHIERMRNTGILWLCFFRREQIQNGSMILYTTRQKSVL